MEHHEEILTRWIYRQSVSCYDMLHLYKYCSSYSGSESVDDYDSLSTIVQFKSISINILIELVEQE